MMRFGSNRAAEKAEDHYNKLHNEMLDRQRVHLQQVADYKQSVIDAKNEKKRIQSENGAFWMQQAEWKRQKKQELKNEPYDPEQVWNIEGPERKAKEAKERKAINQNIKEVNADQQKTFYKRRVDEREQEKKEGQEMNEADLDAGARDKQLLEFKRQFFAQEMIDQWNKQKTMRKNMKEIENEK